jgi:Family of unknown function (DUF6893)
VSAPPQGMGCSRGRPARGRKPPGHRQATASQNPSRAPASPHPAPGLTHHRRDPEIPARTADTDQPKNRRHAMRTLGYITAATMAAAAAALGLLAAMSVPDIRRYLKIRKM